MTKPEADRTSSTAKVAPAPDRESTRPKPPKAEGKNPPEPAKLVLEPQRYAQLTPADKVAYHQAKLAYALAYAEYGAAKRAARANFDKPYDTFFDALEAYNAAEQAVQTAIGTAKDKLKNIGSLDTKLVPGDLVEPDKAKGQLDEIAAAVDEYKKAGDAVAAAVAAREKVKAALAPLAEPDKFHEPNKAAQDLAEDQYALELAQAQVVLETAYDTYMVKRQEIVGHLAYSAEAA